MTTNFHILLIEDDTAVFRGDQPSTEYRPSSTWRGMVTGCFSRQEFWQLENFVQSRCQQRRAEERKNTYRLIGLKHLADLAD